MLTIPVMSCDEEAGELKFDPKALRYSHDTPLMQRQAQYQGRRHWGFVSGFK